MRSNSIVAIVIAVLLMLPLGCSAEPGQPRTFASADALAKGFLEALAGDDLDALSGFFEASYRETLFPAGDEEARASRKLISQQAAVRSEVEEIGPGEKRLLIGERGWPFPFPLVETEQGWHFDSAAGMEEIHNRRVGENELNAIEVAEVYVEAQEAYAKRDRTGNRVREYAQRLVSSKGARDGLYWSVDESSGEELSPFGPLIASAADELEGAERGDAFKGYFFRVLTRQGPGQPAGAYDYVINGHMIAGFALVAFPAEYGETGVMTFVVNHDGVVYQKDRGPWDGLDVYDPDESWTDVSLDEAPEAESEKLEEVGAS